MNEEYLLQIALELRDEASRNLSATNESMKQMQKEMEAVKKNMQQMGDTIKTQTENAYE